MPRHVGLPKMVATDLDGTIVRSDDTVSAYTHEVLGRVREAGIRVVGVTGRGPRLIELCLEHLPAAEFLVLAQGGRVVDLTGAATPGERRVLREVYLDGLVVAGVLDQLEAAVGPLSVMVEALAGPDAPLWGDLHPSWPYPDRVVARSRPDALAGPVLKAFAHSDRYGADELVALAGEILAPGTVTVTQAGLGYLEICPPRVDKGSGLAVVAEALGVDPADVAVFGDMPNDVPMFAWAGWRRVAVANAHPAVLAVADEVTGSNDEDGVAVWLDRLLTGR
jgi:hydroxymethylpyrimidine pyrophosphatase-like HAD family hydrolase